MAARLKSLLSVPPALFKAFGEHMKVNYIQKGRLDVPVTTAIFMLGFTGYFLEYAIIGRHHVAHHHHKVEAALKEYDEKHGAEAGH